LLAAFLRKDLLDLVVSPAKRFDDRIDEFLLGFGLVGPGDFEKITGDCLQPMAQRLNRFVGETFPLGSPLNAIQQVIACEQISRGHESNPADVLACAGGSTKIIRRAPRRADDETGRNAR
jgi:hypothetical protein